MRRTYTKQYLKRVFPEYLDDSVAKRSIVVHNVDFDITNEFVFTKFLMEAFRISKVMVWLVSKTITFECAEHTLTYERLIECKAWSKYMTLGPEKTKLLMTPSSQNSNSNSDTLKKLVTRVSEKHNVKVKLYLVSAHAMIAEFRSYTEARGIKRLLKTTPQFDANFDIDFIVNVK